MVMMWQVAHSRLALHDNHVDSSTRCCVNNINNMNVQLWCDQLYLCSTIRRVATTSNWRSTSALFVRVCHYSCENSPHQRAYGLCDFQLSILNADDSRISVARLINYGHYTFSCKMFGHTRIYIHTNCIQWLGVHEHRGHRVCYTLTKCNYKTKQPSSGKAGLGTLVRVCTLDSPEPVCTVNMCLRREIRSEKLTRANICILHEIKWNLDNSRMTWKFQQQIRGCAQMMMAMMMMMMMGDAVMRVHR